mmetsp:Transcript_64524/g.127467  ORF Transcript_64524/g.127467 Transcript_64524/m.127467 type:complete len:123 (-) Transcript_64524:118-486(-)
MWRSPELGAAAFVLEVTTTYAAWRAWRAARTPADETAATAAAIARYERLFWALSLLFNMPSWYCSSMEMQVSRELIGYPLGTMGTPDTMLMWTWAAALYPMHKLEALLLPRKPESVHNTMLM